MQKGFKRLKEFFIHHFFWTVNYYALPHPRNAYKIIDYAVSSFSGITKNRHIYGSLEWRYKNRPIGHIHGNRVVDILFPKEKQSYLLLFDDRIIQNKYAKNGISLYLKTNQDIELAIELLSQSYELVKQRTQSYDASI